MKAFLVILFFSIQSQADFNFEGCVDLVKYVNGALPQKFGDMTLRSLYCESLDEHLNFNFIYPQDNGQALDMNVKMAIYNDLKARLTPVICRRAQRAWNVTDHVRLNFYDRQKKGFMAVEITQETCSKQ